MENKYYTPEIEEFHPGFEYLISGKKYLFGIPKGTTISVVESYLRNKTIIVKYLDKVDIESLGFKKIRHISSAIASTMQAFEKDNLILVYNKETHTISTFTRDPSKDEIYNLSNSDPNRIGGLVIKNKSELKKLLKQNKND